MPFYIDETSADLNAVASISLIECEDPQIVSELVKLRRLAQTGSRSARVIHGKIKAGEVYRTDYFQTLVSEAQAIIGRLTS